MHRMSNISVRFYKRRAPISGERLAMYMQSQLHEADSRMYYFVASVSTAVSQTFERAFGKTALVRMSPHD